MTFTVTYRAKDGALREERIEAANRAECVAACRRRGIAPTRIAEGRSGKGTASPMGRDKRGPSRVGMEDSKRTTARWVAVAVVLAAIVGGVWWWIGRGEPKTTSVQQQGAKPKVEKPKAEKPQKSAAKSVATNENHVTATTNTVQEAPATNAPYGGVWEGQKIVSYTVKTNGWSTYERIVTADGKKHGVVGSTVKPIFDNGSDQLLAMAVRASQDTEMPPMPLSPLVESDFLESLKKPIVINDDDSEEVKQLKRDVMQAREDMMDLMKKGMTIEQALAEHFKMSNENVGIRNKAVEELRAILDSGDEEGALKYMEAVNATLEKLGAMKIEIPEERIRGRKRKTAPEQQ